MSPTFSSILFRGATVVDGDEGVQPYEADVLVEAGLIARIDPTSALDKADVAPTPEGVRVIDAEGFYLSPGFIDMHAHSDLYLLSHPEHAPKITQGCTVSRGRGPACRPDSG
jgi:N-acyl-D-aspartate/D-glutamate deacylase